MPIHHIKKSLFIYLILAFSATMLVAGEDAGLHDPYQVLLDKYVQGDRFNYRGIFENKADLKLLEDYVNTLEGQRPSEMTREAALAYWINLYNAATLELVLNHYPVQSIKDIGGLLSSPWKRDVVSVEGKKLTLNDIENEIIRPRFEDARIHFALNCASIGCPPLLNEAFVAERLEEQLEKVTREALEKSRWVEIAPGEIRLSKIFDWYRGDFEAESGSLRAYVANYLPGQKEALMDESRKISFVDYDWQLNAP